MLGTFQNEISCAFVALAAALGCCLAAGVLGRATGLIDRPDGGRKRHARPTPLIGGIAIMAAVPVALAACGGSGDGAIEAAALLAFGLLGLADDRRPISAPLRLGAAALLTAGLVAIDGRDPASLLLFVPAVLGMMAAVNMADGLDGLVPGLAFAWALALFGPMPASGPFAAALAAAVAAVLAFNLAGRLFLGNAGSHALGGLFGYAHADAMLAAPDAIVPVALWGLVPALDAMRVVGSRIAARRSAFAADRSHLHQRLEDRWGKRRALAAYLAAAIAPALAAAAWPEAASAAALAALLFYALVLRLTRPAATPASGRVPIAERP
jgi:UDP-GlcNAc:undecaprenyl-phosphate GlcNAc-1-phosphate transferase